MDEAELKEAYRLFWMVKGHIDCSDETALQSADSYFKRLWRAGSDGAPLYAREEGFEEAYLNKKLSSGQ
jgi:hypothetical protein